MSNPIVSGTKFIFNERLDSIPIPPFEEDFGTTLILFNYDNWPAESRPAIINFIDLDQSTVALTRNQLVNDGIGKSPQYGGWITWGACGPHYSEWIDYYVYSDRGGVEWKQGPYYAIEFEFVPDDLPIYDERFISLLEANATRVNPPGPGPGPTDPPTFTPHSITFFDIPDQTRSANEFVAVCRNTFDHWHMVPEERPIVKMPAQKTKYLEVPGSDGILDLSELITGQPLYNNREGDFSFYILNGYDTFENIKTEIANYLHGRKKYMVLSDDLSYLYEGRFEVDFENDDSLNHSKCTISYNLKPYKVRFSHSITDSEWIIEEIFPNERLL